MTIAENLRIVHENMNQACHRTRRDIDSVRLIAVSKTQPFEKVIEAMDCGQMDFGENKVQELCSKFFEKDLKVFTHYIGHLQRNKVKCILDDVFLIHSLDRIDLADEIQRIGSIRNHPIQVLVQVNIGRESQKSGVYPEHLQFFLQQLSGYSAIKVKGLMAIPPYTSNPDEARLYFREMKKLFLQMKDLNIPNIFMNELSMGMSHDYEIAIEEGSTMIRVGTAIFGERNAR